MVLKSVHVCEYHRCVPVWWERLRQGWCIAAIFHAVADVVFIGLRRRWDATHVDVHRTLNVSRQKDLARLYTLYEANRIIKTSWIRFKLFSTLFNVTLSCSSLFLVADITIIVWIFSVNWKSSHIYTLVIGDVSGANVTDAMLVWLLSLISSLADFFLCLYSFLIIFLI